MHTSAFTSYDISINNLYWKDNLLKHLLINRAFDPLLNIVLNWCSKMDRCPNWSTLVINILKLRYYAACMRWVFITCNESDCAHCMGLKRPGLGLRPEPCYYLWIQDIFYLFSLRIWFCPGPITRRVCWSGVRGAVAGILINSSARGTTDPSIGTISPSPDSGPQHTPCPPSATLEQVSSVLRDKTTQPHAHPHVQRLMDLITP